MPADVRVSLNQAGIRALLHDPEVSADLTRRGLRIAAAAGDGFAVTTTTNNDRSVVFVTTTTEEARAAEAEGRALSRAVDRGR